MEGEDFIAFVGSISVFAAEKMREEKITKDLVNHMSDDELSNYLPLHGDRLRLRTYLRKQESPQKKKHRLLSLLQQKLQTSTSKKQTEDNPEAEEMRNPHRPYGNRNATKQKRQVELGWIHKTNKRSIQVRKNKGGGTRKTEMPKTSVKSEIMEEAISLFFPNGKSPKGPISNFNFDLWDFSDRPIDANVTIADMYEMTKMPLLRFYLATSYKDRSEVVDLTENNDILSKAIQLSGITDESDHSLHPDPFVESQKMGKEVCLRLHRGHILKEFIQAFEDIDPTKDIISLQMVMPDGTLEAAEDSGGVTRDALSDFWISFYDQCTLGKTFKIPVLRHDFAEKQWQSVAKIILFGWNSCGYFPIELSIPFLQMCLFGRVSVDILAAFLQIIPEDEANTLKMAMSAFDSVDEEELLDIFQIHESKTLPTADNITRVLNEIAHKEIVQTPMFVVDCFQPVLKKLGISESKLDELYKELIPTPKVVNKMLRFPDVLCSEEQTVANHLRRLVREMNHETLRKFLRFCTGSDLMVNKEIQVSFVNVSGLARRPVAHTCSCLLELSKDYETFPQFRSEFMAVLESNVWVMDII